MNFIVNYCKELVDVGLLLVAITYHVGVPVQLLLSTTTAQGPNLTAIPSTAISSTTVDVNFDMARRGPS